MNVSKYSVGSNHLLYNSIKVTICYFQVNITYFSISEKNTQVSIRFNKYTCYDHYNRIKLRVVRFIGKKIQLDLRFTKLPEKECMMEPDKVADPAEKGSLEYYKR